MLSKSDIENELAKRSIAYFVKRAQADYVFAEFNLKILNALETFLKDVVAAKRPILIIQAPPQHGKTELVSRKFPAYAFGKNPNLRIAGCSYGADLAIAINRDIQKIMLSDEYQAIFPDSCLNRKRAVTLENVPLRNSERFDIVGHSGYYICAGIGGPLTGKSVDIGIIDDPIKNMKEARSSAKHEELTAWYRTVFLTRLSKNSGQLIMATRWTLDDLTGYILSKNQNNSRVQVLKFPAISQRGKALLPSLHPLTKLQEQKEAMTAEEWSALYQQEPVVLGGNVIKTSGFMRYKELPPLLYTKLFADTAMTIKKSSDYTVFGLFGYDYNANCYLIDLWRAKLESPAVLDLAQSLWDRFINASDLPYPKPRALAIENKANGIHIIQEFQRRKIPVEVLEPKSKDYRGNLYVADKLQRLMDVLPYISAGRYYIPAENSGKQWLKDYLIECESFSRDNSHVHDDQIDITIYAIKDLIERQSSIMPQSFSRGLRQRRE